MKQTEFIDPKDFYQNLGRKDKGKFLRYLTKRYDYPAATMSAKLRENSNVELRKDELENLIKIISEEIWKN